MCSDGEPTAKYLTKGIFPTQPGLTALTQKTDLKLQYIKVRTFRN